MTEHDAANTLDTPLPDQEITTMVAKLADMILGLTEDPTEHTRIVADLGSVLEAWEHGYPFTAHPYTHKDVGGRMALAIG